MLNISGAVDDQLNLSFEDLAGFDRADRIDDVSALDERRQGTAVRLGAILRRAASSDEASHVTLHSTDGFAASVPIEDVRDVGLLIFSVNGSPLPDSAGGPVRFLVPNPAMCGTAVLDACANVKHVCRIEVTVGQGRDTRQSR